MNSLPAALIKSLQNIKGFNEEAFKAVHQSGGQITSIRFNPNKFAYSLKASPFGGSLQENERSSLEGAVPWSSNGFYLSERPSFTLDPLFHAGAYYVQEASSMFLEEALKQTVDIIKPLKVLDLCAAPGGKSTLIQSVISKESLLVSNEVIKTRVNILSENITKWGAANVIVTNNDPTDFKRIENYFDVIVVDAPCSGSGLFRKDPNAINEWSENNVELCARRQQRILADIMPSLKDGGVLIYSTCSYSQQEDEAIEDWLAEALKVESLKLKLDESWGIVETVSEQSGSFGYRFYPDKVKGEGFFIAAFKKVSGNEMPSPTKKLKSTLVSNTETEMLLPYLENSNRFAFIKQDENILAMPKELLGSLSDIQSALYIKKAGVKMGAVIRGELVPAHELGVSTVLSAIYPKINVSIDTALDYLRRKDISVDTKEKGWTLIKFAEHTLGFIKILPGRVNNYYPKELRILNR